MAGRKKKGKAGKVKNQAAKSPEMVLKQAEEMLSTGRFVRAREGFRRLFKMDPEVYRERFVEVTLLAIDETIGAGKSEQAGQWLRHLKDDLGVPAEELKIAELKLAKSGGDGAATTELALFQLASEDEAERRSGADALVLLRAPEAGAVCDAISHLCKGEWDAVGKAMESVGRRSPFAHWRLFLKGCVAYYKNDRELAETCFLKLPAGTLPARKAEAFGKWRWSGTEKVGEAEIQQACIFLKEPEMAKAASKAEDFWNQKQYMKSYELLRNSRVGFPAMKVSLAGQITRFFQHADKVLSNDEFQRWEDIMSRALLNGRFDTKIDDYILINTLIHRGCYDPVEIWKDYRDNREAVRGKCARFTAMCHYAVALEMLDSAGGRSAYHMAAANRSVFPILEESVNADPSYELTSMKLLDVYEQLKLKSERNKLLDKMVKQFPDSDVVLLKAGSACLDRGVYVKGLAYLEKARAASPLNNEIAAKIRQGLVQKAVAHYKKGGEADVKKARATFEQIFVETGSLAVDGISLRAVYYLELSVLEDLALGKKGSRGDEIRAQFVDMEPQLMEYIESLYSSEYAPLFHKLFKGKALKAPYTPGLALQMFQFLESVYIPSRSLSLGENGIPLLHNYLERALKKLEVTDRDVLIRLYGTFEKSGYYWVTHTEGMVKRYLKLDKEDPLFTVWKWKNDICEPTKKQIAKVRAAAVSRGDVLASKALDAYVKFIEEEDDFDYDDTYGYDPFDIDDDDDDDGFGKIYEGLKNMSSSERIEAFMAQGSTRDEAKSICKVFDEMEELENSFSDDSPIKPKKKVAKKAKKKVTQKKTENESALDEGQGEFPF